MDKEADGCSNSYYCRPLGLLGLLPVHPTPAAQVAGVGHKLEDAKQTVHHTSPGHGPLPKAENSEPVLSSKVLRNTPHEQAGKHELSQTEGSQALRPPEEVGEGGQASSCPHGPVGCSMKQGSLAGTFGAA